MKTNFITKAVLLKTCSVVKISIIIL